MSWFLLAMAILFEVAGTTSMKLAEGFTRLVPSVLIFVFYAASFALLTVAIRRIDLAVAYAVWSGLGTALIAVIAVIAFGESMPPMKVGALALIIVGVVGALFGGALTTISYSWLSFLDGAYFVTVTFSGSVIGFFAAAMEGESLIIDVLERIRSRFPPSPWRL